MSWSVGFEVAEWIVRQRRQVDDRIEPRKSDG